MAIKGVRSRSLARYNVDANMDRHKRNLAQLQLILLEMERQLLIISAMIDRLRSRWGLPVTRQRRHRRYRFRPWPTRAELEEDGQYSRPMPMHHLNDSMAHRNFIQMPSELYQELEQRITAEFQRDRTLMRDPISPGVKLAVTLRYLATGDSNTTLQYAFRVASPTIEKFVPEVCDTITRPQTPRGLVAGQVRLPPEVELSTCPGYPGWKAYSSQMSTRGRQPLSQQQRLPLYCTLGPGGWRFQVPVGGHWASRVNFR